MNDFFIIAIVCSLLVTGAESKCYCFGSFSLFCFGEVDDEPCPGAQHVVLFNLPIEQKTNKLLDRLGSMNDLKRVDTEDSNTVLCDPGVRQNRSLEFITVCHPFETTLDNSHQAPCERMVELINPNQHITSDTPPVINVLSSSISSRFIAGFISLFVLDMLILLALATICFAIYRDA